MHNACALVLMGLDGGLMGLMESFFVKDVKGHQGSVVFYCVDDPSPSPSP